MTKCILKKKGKTFKSIKTFECFFCGKKNTQTKTEHKQMELDGLDNLETTSENAREKELEQIDEAEQSVSKQKSKKKKIINALFFILNIVVVASILIYQLTNEKVTPFSDLIKIGLKWWFIPVIILCFLMVMFLDSLRTNMFIKRSGNRSRPFLSYKTCAVGKYYDAITPLSTGGQAFQVFYLNKRGLDASSAISVPMARYVVSQIGWMIVSFFAIFFLIKFQLASASVISVASIIGFILNATILLITLILSLSKKLGKKLVIKSLKILQKMHIVKNYEKQYEKVMKVVGGYQQTMSEYAKSMGSFIFVILISVIIYLFNFSIPFFIYLFLGGTHISMWANIMILSIMIELAAGFVPLPGGTGMNEISFTVIFATIFPEGTIFWALLFWRFMNYYIYLIQGIGIVIYDYAFGNRKYNWLKRKWELESESAIFKEQQLKKKKKKKA